MWGKRTKILGISRETLTIETMFEPSRKESFLPAEKILKKALAGTPDMVLLSGRTPVRHPEIIKILRGLKAVGIQAGLICGGVSFSDAGTVSKLKSAGLDLAVVVLPGFSGLGYEEICGRDLWPPVRQGLSNLVEQGIDLVLDIPVFMPNLALLGELKKLCMDLNTPLVRFFYPRIDQARTPQRYPRLTLVARAVRTFAAHYEGRVCVRGVPACFPVGRAHRFQDEDDNFFPWENGTQKLAACTECLDFSTCRGIPEGYLELHGVPYSGPLVKPVSSSFDFIETDQRLAGSPVPGTACFAVSGIPKGYVPERCVFIKESSAASKQNWRLYHTDSRDFATKQIVDITKHNGQLYLDASHGPTVTDFARELQRLKLHEACRHCELLSTCPGCFMPATSPAFHEESQVIADLISRLHGRVLDVGAGEGYYRETIKTLLKAGRIEYHALDPEDTSLQSLLQALPQVRVYSGMIENAKLPVAGFDHVIAIRSINHFRSLHHAFNNIERILKGGGTLLVTDGLALPLARTRDKVLQARSLAPGGFQHHRNFSSHQFIKFLSAYPFEVIFHRPVGPETSNEWVVLARKTGK